MSFFEEEEWERDEIAEYGEKLEDEAESEEFSRE
jgi:hypothetical protein